MISKEEKCAEKMEVKRFVFNEDDKVEEQEYYIIDNNLDMDKKVTDEAKRLMKKSKFKCGVELT